MPPLGCVQEKNFWISVDIYTFWCIHFYRAACCLSTNLNEWHWGLGMLSNFRLFHPVLQMLYWIEQHSHAWMKVMYWSDKWIAIPTLILFKYDAFCCISIPVNIFVSRLPIPYLSDKHDFPSLRKLKHLFICCICHFLNSWMFGLGKPRMLKAVFHMYLTFGMRRLGGWEYLFIY